MTFCGNSASPPSLWPRSISAIRYSRLWHSTSSRASGACSYFAVIICNERRSCSGQLSLSCLNVDQHCTELAWCLSCTEDAQRDEVPC